MAENQIFSLPNILIIDDVNSNLMLLADIIRNAGYIARPVASARQAVNAIEALPPSLILMDISMPEIDGYVFCTMLKNNIITRDIPVIFISALSSTEDKIKGFKAGAVDYIAKPFEVEEVILRINIHLHMYRLKQDMEAYNKRLFTIINHQIKGLIDEQKNVVVALSKIVLKKDPSKTEHLDRIAKNSKILAMSLQMSQKYLNIISTSFIDAIELSAPLHDIGNIILDNRLLFKQDLDEGEQNAVKSHASIGAELLEEIYSINKQNEYIKMAIEIAGNHHENWDGSGYPAGLKGAEIPISARIVSVVHEYDRLMNAIEEDKALSREESVNRINEAAGSLFDPDIVAIFNKIKHQLK